MKNKTLKNKLNTLEQAFATVASIYCSMNLTKNLVFGTVYQTIGNKKYSINDYAKVSENASYVAISSYWESLVSKEYKDMYSKQFDAQNLINNYENGNEHIVCSYWMENVLSEPMYAQQHMIMYKDEETGDVLATTYILDKTKEAFDSIKLDTEQKFLEVICRDYTSVHFVDLNRDIAEPLKIEFSANASLITHLKVRHESSYSKSIQDYYNKYVVGDNRKEFIRVMDRDYLLQEMKELDRFVYRYESRPNKAGQCYFEVQVARVKESEFDGNVIVAFRYIDDILTKEQRYQWELEKIAYTDALTNIGNRAAFSKELMSYAKEKSAACMVADVNNLKLCNDRYGHKEGDRIIKDAAECISEAFKGIGKCFRIGGDEFCVLMPEGDESKIKEALEKVKHIAEKKSEHRIMPLSVACGYAMRESIDESMEQLFNRSDECMYEVKYTMKNEFPIYSQEKIKNYLNVLKTLSKSMDSYLYLWDITRNENWFIGDIDNEFAVREKGAVKNTMEQMEAIVYEEDRQALKDDLRKISSGVKDVHNMNYRWMNRKGEPVWISCRGTVINDDKGRPFVMVGRVSVLGQLNNKINN